MHLITRTTHERACCVLGLARARREPAESGEGGRDETGLPPAVGAEEVVYIPQDWNPEEASADGH